MATLTYRTTDEKRDKLKGIAEKAGVSVNRLIDDWATYAIAESEACYINLGRYQVMSQNGASHLGDAAKTMRSKANNKGIED